MEVLARKHTYTYTHTSKNWDTHKHKKQKRFRALVSPVHSQDHVSVLFLYFLLWFTHNHNLLQGFSCLWKSGSTSTSLTTASCHCLHWTTICLSAVNVTLYNGSRGQGSMEACEDGAPGFYRAPEVTSFTHTHTARVSCCFFTQLSDWRTRICFTEGEDCGKKITFYNSYN